jgi:hypothetical protein
VGSIAIMSPPLSEKFAFTSVQERQSMKQSLDDTIAFSQQNQGGDIASEEWQGKLFEFREKRFRDNILTEEQRKAWDAFLEPTLAPDEVKVLRKLSKQRTEIMIKVPGK